MLLIPGTGQRRASEACGRRPPMGGGASRRSECRGSAPCCKPRAAFRSSTLHKWAPGSAWCAQRQAVCAARRGRGRHDAARRGTAAASGRRCLWRCAACSPEQRLLHGGSAASRLTASGSSCSGCPGVCQACRTAVGRACSTCACRMGRPVAPRTPAAVLHASLLFSLHLGMQHTRHSAWVLNAMKPRRAVLSWPAGGR